MIKAVIVEDVETISNQLENFVKYDPMFDLLAKYTDAESALALIPHDKPNVVILDINLLGPKSGLDVLVVLRQKYPDMKFLMYTGLDSDDKLLDAIALGAHGYILKSEAITTIPNHCRTIMRGEGAMTGRMLARWMEISTIEQKEKPEEFAKLEELELDIVRLVAKGLTDQEIADRVGKTVVNVRQILYRIRMNKLNVKTRYRLIVMYWKAMGWGGPRLS